MLLDTARYADWSEHLRFHAPLAVGDKVPMSVRLFGQSITVKVRIEALDEARELRWRGGPPGLITGTHYLRLEASNGGTLLRHGEVFRGIALPLLWPGLRGELGRFYRAINRALKARVEGAQAG